jgi:hypothetical protein
MKDGWQSCALLTLVVLLTACSCSGKSEPHNEDKMMLDIEIIPEFPDGAYTLSWNDTLCASFSRDHRYLEKRPRELHCYILNSKGDTLGYYRGLSSPRQWTYFRTTDASDSVISLIFSIGVNQFSTFLSEQTDEYIDRFNQSIGNPTTFKTVMVNINSALHVKKKIELTNANDSCNVSQLQ